MGDDGGEFARRTDHPLTPDVLVAVVENLRVGRSAKWSFDGGEFERRERAHGDLKVVQVLAVGLYDAAEGQVTVRRQSAAGRRKVSDHFDADRRSPEARLQDIGSRKGQ